MRDGMFRPMKIMGFKCPSCRSTDWLYVRRSARHYVRCLDCGQVRLLLIRPLPLRAALAKTATALKTLFPAADA
jgi:uncharacterized Zn finger protein